MLHTFVALVQDKHGFPSRLASLFRGLSINIMSLAGRKSERPGASCRHAFPVQKLALTALVLLSLFGCKTSPPPATPKSANKAAAETYYFLPRPTVAAPAVKVFHQDEDTYTLVTKENATDDEIAAIIWEFRDAAHAKTFDKLHLSEKFIDARKPTVWIHVYRGTKCANEKFTTGKYPCGAKYNGAGDYTLGGYSNPLWDDGVLHTADGKETKLWDPDVPYTATPK